MEPGSASSESSVAVSIISKNTHAESDVSSNVEALETQSLVDVLQSEVNLLPAQTPASLDQQIDYQANGTDQSSGFAGSASSEAISEESESTADVVAPIIPKNTHAESDMSSDEEAPETQTGIPDEIFQRLHNIPTELEKVHAECMELRRQLVPRCRRDDSTFFGVYARTKRVYAHTRLAALEVRAEALMEEQHYLILQGFGLVAID